MKYGMTRSATILLIVLATVALMFGCDDRVTALEGEESVDETTLNSSARATAATAGDVDEPEGFTVDVVAPHAPFSDELASQFRLKFAEGGTGTIVNNLDDTSTIIVAEVSWDPEGTSGWHRHPGVAIVNIVEGDLEVTWKQDCEPRTYTAGESFFDPGDIHNAINLSDSEGAFAYVTFVGIPDGEPATEWVEPVDC